MRAILLALALTAATAQQAGAWGTSGHAIVAELAQRRLEPRVLQKLKDLLGGEVSLASVAGWADAIQLLRPATKRWHFVNIPVGATSYEAARDCLDTPQGDCILNAIERFRLILADPSLPTRERLEALMFAVHLVADIHQPLHCAERDNDAGGTTLMVTFFGQPMSLHAVWDVALLEKRSYDWGEIARGIEQQRHFAEEADELSRWQPAAWAWQTHQVAVNVAYDLPPGIELGQGYFQNSFPVVERQLALAALRLARMLNETLR